MEGLMTVKYICSEPVYNGHHFGTRLSVYIHVYRGALHRGYFTQKTLILNKQQVPFIRRHLEVSQRVEDSKKINPQKYTNIVFMYIHVHVCVYLPSFRPLLHVK